MFRVSWKDEYPKKRREFHLGVFKKRQQARQWCRNRRFLYEEMSIHHPDGQVEWYTPPFCLQSS